MRKSTKTTHTDKEHVFKKKRFSFKDDKEDKKEEVSHEKIVKSLTKIYQNQDGTLPDMKHFEKLRRSRTVRMFFTVVVAGLFFWASALLGMVWWESKQLQKSDVFFSIAGEESLTIGDKVRFQLNYRNTRSTPISQAEVTVRYPEGFVFEKSNPEPTNASKDEWKLGSLGAEEGGTIEIEGKLYGSVNEQKSLRAFFTYLPANFSSEFQKVSTLTMTLGNSPVNLVFTGPLEGNFGSPLQMEIVVAKDSQFNMHALELVVEAPDNFEKKSSDPHSDQLSDLVWSINQTVNTSTIKLQGTLFVPPDISTSTFPIFAKVLGYAGTQKTGNPYVLAQAVYTPNLLQTALDAKVVVNGALSEADVSPGETLNTSVVLKNTGQTALKNVELSLIFSAPSINKQSMLNWKEVLDGFDGIIVGKQVDDTRRLGIITWNSKQIAELLTIAPGKEARVDVSLPIKKNSDEAENYTSWNIAVSAEAKYDLDKERKTLNSNTVNLTVKSDLSLEVRDEISNNTTHTVTWLLGNTYHALKNIEVSAEVYGSAVFDDSKLTVPSGEAKFDKDKKMVIWTIPEMPLGVDVHALQFTLNLPNPNPTQTQLTSKVKVKAFDTVTQKEILLAGDEVLLSAQEGD